MSAISVSDGRLCLDLGTLGDGDPVVWRGMRTVVPLNLSLPWSLAFVLDWNEQVNGCYLEAGIYLSPIATEGTADHCSDWWKLTYVGVPPGRNARTWCSYKLNGGERVLFDDEWPAQRTGRTIGLQRIVIRCRDGNLEVTESGRILLSHPATALPFPQAYLYLQMKSHSNYPSRRIFFDEIEFNGPDE